MNLQRGCIFRESFDNAASSYIIQAAEHNSRTIVSHNPVPEMTTKEFIESASAIRKENQTGICWYHFEGRIPTVTAESVNWLREKLPMEKISVECEKPDRVYMGRVSEHADVVFFSKLWAEVSLSRLRYRYYDLIWLLAKLRSLSISLMYMRADEQ